MLRLRLLPLLLATTVVANPLFAQNDKQVIGDPVITPEDIAADAPVLYLIRFQNVGQDTVQQVVIRDTLDPRFNPSSFNMLGASHDYQLLGEGGSVIRWYFEDIQLPDSTTGGSNSIGFVLFSVQPLPFLVPGQTILNRACISFDDSVDICTNQTVVWVDGGSSVSAVEENVGAYQVVPNPNYGEFEVRKSVQPNTSAGRSSQCWITDIRGRRVWNGTADHAVEVSQQIRLDRPVPGHYLLWVQTDRKLQVERFTVVR